MVHDISYKNPQPNKPKGFARFSELCYFAVEYAILSIIPLRAPGPISRRLFKIPNLLHKLGLNGLLGNRVLLLKTIGRRSGREHITALGHSYDPASNTYHVTAGWEKPPDWYLNLKANPKVRVRIGASEFECYAELVPEEVVMVQMAAYANRNPFAARIFSRATGTPFDGSETCLRKVAKQFASVTLRPTVGRY